MHSPILLEEVTDGSIAIQRGSSFKATPASMAQQLQPLHERHTCPKKIQQVRKTATWETTENVENAQRREGPTSRVPSVKARRI